MALSPAVWAIIFAHCSNNFGNYTLMTKLPAFMKEVLKFDIKAVSFVTFTRLRDDGRRSSELPFLFDVLEWVILYPALHSYVHSG